MSLSVQAFSAALRKGLGRAMILVRQEADDPALQAELMRACKSSLLYDGQFEHPRAPYLHRLIQVTGQEQRFSQELSRWLAEVGAADDGVDTAQAFHVLCLLAGEDPSFDRRVLHDFVRRATYDMIGLSATQAFIRLEGIEALLLYVCCFTDEIAEEAWSFGYLVEALKEREGSETAASALAAARATCPELDRLMAIDVDALHAEPADTVDYAAAKEVLAAGGKLLPSAWSRHASFEELAEAARDLLAETDRRKIQAYLALFRFQPFPAPTSSLFPFVRHEDEMVARDAARVLGRVGRSGVRELALELLDGERAWNGIELLQGSYQPGDFQRIGKRLEDATLDADGWHHVGLAVFSLMQDREAPPEESRTVLLRLYEEEPCSFCRSTLVSAAAGGLPGRVAEECRYDAEPDTVRLVSQGDLSQEREPAAAG